MRGNIGIWTKDVTVTDFTAVRTNNPQIVYNINVTYPNQYPPAGTPIVLQQIPGSYTQAGIPYQAGSYQAPGFYTQPQGDTGLFSHPQAQPRLYPYPQV